MPCHPAPSSEWPSGCDFPGNKDFFFLLCSAPPGATLTLLARTNKANFWILGRTHEDICGLGVDRQVCSGELLSTYPMATQLKVSNLASFECANALHTDKSKLRFFRRPTSSAVLASREHLSASTTCPQLVPRLGTWILSWLNRSSSMRHQSLSITQLPRCSPQPLPLDLSALANLDPWAAYPHLLVKLLRSLVPRNNAMKFRTPPLDHTCRMHQGSWTSR